MNLESWTCNTGLAMPSRAMKLQSDYNLAEWITVVAGGPTSKSLACKNCELFSIFHFWLKLALNLFKEFAY